MRGNVYILMVSIEFPILLLICYIISLSYRIVKPFIPFISYLGNYQPAYSFFSFGFNLLTVQYLLINQARHEQLVEMCGRIEMEPENRKKLKKCLAAYLIVGAVSSLGLHLLATYPRSLQQPIHVLGAVSTTLLFYCYMIFDTYFSFTLMSEATTRALKAFRLSLVIVETICMVVCFSISAYNRLMDVTETLPVNIHYVNRKFISAEALMEWLISICNIFYLGSFYPDFRKILLEPEGIVIE